MIMIIALNNLIEYHILLVIKNTFLKDISQFINKESQKWWHTTVVPTLKRLSEAGGSRDPRS